MLDAIWPKDTVHSDAALRLLDRMEDRGIMPETQTFETILRVRAAVTSCGFARPAHAAALALTPPTAPASLTLSLTPRRRRFPTSQCFGRASMPVKKVRAMAYWMRRYIASNPFALPETLPDAPEQRALLYLKRMSDAPATGR